MAAKVYAKRNFTLLAAGEAISSLGDQFTLIALPWLVMKLSSDPAVLGAVMAAAAVPRALLMLLGGAITDRLSPRASMLYANIVRFALVLTLGAITLTNGTELWMVYVFSVLFGIADAFFIPAQNSIVPQVVEKQRIGMANVVVQGASQLSQFIGPLLVGIMIGTLDKQNGLTGIGYAFIVDALSFLFSLLTLGLMKVRRASRTHEEGLLASIQKGLSTVWNHTYLRTIIVLVAGVNLFLVGPVLVGMPIMIEQQLHGTAFGYGIVMSMWGVGILLGFIAAGALPKPREERIGPVLFALVVLMGAMLMGMGWARSVTALSVLSFVMSLANGYVSLLAITMIQQSFPEVLMGRIMSIITFSSMGLIPVSEAVSGVVLRFGASALFIGSSLLYIAYVLVILFLGPNLRGMGAGFAKT